MIKSFFTNTFLFLFILVLVVGCVPRKLIITSQRMPETLGIRMVNNAAISQDDWKRYTSATDSFIQKYNHENQLFKLYLTSKDSNSVKLDFMANSYAGKKQQNLGLLVTAAGIVTPFLLAAFEAPFIVAFWYIPRNNTTLWSSLSTDLNQADKKVIQNIQTRHQFKSLEKQKEKQKNAYFNYLNTMVKGLVPDTKAASKAASKLDNIYN